MENKRDFISPQAYIGIVKIEVKVTEELVFQAIEEALRIDRRTLMSKTRKREVVEARYIFFHVMREHTRDSLAKIGRTFLKDHATVLHGLRTFKSLMLYPRFREAVDDVYTVINRTYMETSVKESTEGKTIRSLYKLKNKSKLNLKS
jgi:chromosomal replication initiator protein